MILFLSLFAQLLHLGVMLLAAPCIAGLAEWLERRLAGYTGTSPLLPWHEVVRLWRKQPLVQDNLSPVSAVAPPIALAAMLAAVALVPSFTLGMALSPLADLPVVVGLLMTERISLALAVFDSSAAAPGVAIQDGAGLAVLAETALLLLTVALGLMAGGFNLDVVVLQQHEGMLLPATASVVALTALLIVILTEATRAESLHEQVFNGPDLALVRLAAWLRRLVWINLTGSLFLPIGMASIEAGPFGWAIGLLCWAAKLFLFLFGLTFVHTALGRIPRRRLPDLIGVATLLALLAVTIVLASTTAV